MSKDYEKKGLIVSMIGSLMLSTSAIVMALITDSQAILLDGLYTFITLTMALLSLKVLFFIKQPETKNRPFGFMIFEPFLNILKCIVMVSILLVFLVSNIQELYRGGRLISLNLTTLYIFICLAIYILIILILLKCGKHTKSSILALEIKNWCIDAFQTAGIAVSLIAAILFYRLGYTEILPYIDPVIVIALVILSLPIPIKVFNVEIKRLLLISPENNTEKAVKEQLKEIISKYGFRDIQVWSLNSGRTNYLFIYIDLEKEKVTVSHLDEIRKAVFKELSCIYSDFWADIMFTKINPESTNAYNLI